VVFKWAAVVVFIERSSAPERVPHYREQLNFGTKAQNPPPSQGLPHFVGAHQRREPDMAVRTDPGLRWRRSSSTMAALSIPRRRMT